MKRHALELLRYGINGVVATVVHFAVLSFNLNVLGFQSAGAANMLAAVFGIAASFMGSRYFVFPRTGETIIAQAVKFSGLYGVIALLHGLTLLIWTDWYGFDYKTGFLIATVVQISLSYFGNKFLVFKA
jgi:putative flippase GtrA